MLKLMPGEVVKPLMWTTLARAMKRCLSYRAPLPRLWSWEGNLDLGADTRRSVNIRDFLGCYQVFRRPRPCLDSESLGYEMHSLSGTFSTLQASNGTCTVTIQPVIFLAAGFGFDSPPIQSQYFCFPPVNESWKSALRCRPTNYGTRDFHCILRKGASGLVWPSPPLSVGCSIQIQRKANRISSQCAVPAGY